MSASPPDRDYATQELYALFTSVLYGLEGRTINRACPRGLSGPHLATPEWLRAAGVVGLATSRYRSTQGSPQTDGQSTSLFVIGDEVVAQANQSIGPPDRIIEGCRRLAALLEVDLLAADFDVIGANWRLTGGCCTPDLRLGGDELLDSFARLLQ